MKLHLKITAGLLLLVQAFHLASLQVSTDSTGKTIDPSWLRVRQNPKEQASDGTNVPSNDYSGAASGSIADFTEEEENLANQDTGTKESDDQAVTTTAPPTFQTVTTKQPELPDTTVSPSATTPDATNSSQFNTTEAEEEFHKSTMTPQSSTAHQRAQNATNFPDYSNHTDLQTTTSAPEGNATTQESTTKPEEDLRLFNETESSDTTARPTTTTPEIHETTTTSSSTTVFLSETTETSPATTTAAAPITPEKVNNSDKASASGSSSDRGLASDAPHSKRHGAWGAVLGTAVAVACVGLVAYIILKNKQQKDFSHRKLVEEYPSDPVLRLDNSEPLDLNFGGSAYYNPGLQGDNIQMTNFPGRH